MCKYQQLLVFPSMRKGPSFPNMSVALDQTVITYDLCFGALKTVEVLRISLNNKLIWRGTKVIVNRCLHGKASREFLLANTGGRQVGKPQ